MPDTPGQYRCVRENMYQSSGFTTEREKAPRCHSRSVRRWPGNPPDMTIWDTGGLMKRTLIIFLMLLAMAFPALSQAAGEGGERILDYAVTARVEEDAAHHRQH